MPRKTQRDSKSYLEKVETDLKSSQSKLSLILGALIVLVVGVLVFNYFNKPKSELGPSQNTQTQQADVTPDKLPGKYTVKEGDTLFLIAEKYYQDGFKFTEIAKANKLVNADAIETGQVLEIPKLAENVSSPSPQPSEPVQEAPAGEKGAQLLNPVVNQFGPPIAENTYTVVEGDWLSTIAARAYGDMMAYPRLAQANNIANPDYILPGMVLTIPR